MFIITILNLPLHQLMHLSGIFLLCDHGHQQLANIHGLSPFPVQTAKSKP
jgi:hypothetical protein